MSETHKSDRNSLHVTLEMLLWAAVLILALLLRLVDLDKAPLSAREAGTAILAWQGAADGAAPLGGYSPLLLAACTGLFAAIGSSDALARLWPALAGTALVVAPVLLRRHLGAMGALAAGLCLALSPTAIVASRQLDPTVCTALGAAGCLGGALRFVDSADRRWLLFAVAALAMTLVAGGPAAGMLIPLGAAGGVTLALRWTERDFGRLGQAVREYWIKALIVFVAVSVILGTGFWWNPSGLGAWVDSMLAWVAGSGSAQPHMRSLALLLFYEPLVMAWGIVGLVRLLRERRSPGVLLGVWALVAFLVLLILPDRAPLDILAGVLPMALLAGVGIGYVVTDLQQKAAWSSIRLYVPVVIVLWAYMGLMLDRYGAQGQDVDLLLALLGFLMQALLLALFALLTGGNLAMKALAVGSGLLLLVYTFSVGWGVAHVRPTDPREPLTNEPTADEVRDLVGTLRELSWQQTGMPNTLAFAYDAGSDPVLDWYLRQFSAAQAIDLADLAESTDVVPPVLVTRGRDLALSSSEYLGQDFPLHRTWEFRSLSCVWTSPVNCSEGVRWWLLRRTPVPPAIVEWVTLWVEETDGAPMEP